MRYVKIEDGQVVQYPITGTDIVLANPQTSFRRGELSVETMAAYGCLPVVEVDPPAPLAGHSVVEGTPEAPDGVWRQVWRQEPMTAEEIAAAAADADDDPGR